jgi:hypothetical protein
VDSGPIVNTPRGKSGGGGTRRGGSVLHCGGGVVDSPETAESMIFVAAVLCTTQVMDISTDIRYPRVTDMDMIFYP